MSTIYCRNIRYLSPERLLGATGNVKSDVWSIGIILVELLFQCTLWSSLKMCQILRKIFSLINTENVLEKIAIEHNAMELYSVMHLA